jgi:hypothetical protein
MPDRLWSYFPGCPKVLNLWSLLFRYGYHAPGNEGDVVPEHVSIRTGYRTVLRSSEMNVASSVMACAISR